MTTRRRPPPPSPVVDAVYIGAIALLIIAIVALGAWLINGGAL